MSRKSPKRSRPARVIGWEEHDPRLYELTDRIFRNGYAAHLVQDWIPALEGAEAKLRTGASVADVGCGHGSSTIQMAKAYPMSRFVGYDYHLPSIEAAREAAAKAGLADRLRFEVAAANALSEKNFDLICCFDCVHDMGDPVGVLAHIRSRLKPNGTFMMVEPYAGDTLESNITPVGRVFTALRPCSARRRRSRRTLAWRRAPKPARPVYARWRSKLDFRSSVARRKRHSISSTRRDRKHARPFFYSLSGGIPEGFSLAKVELGYFAGIVTNLRGICVKSKLSSRLLERASVYP